MPSIQTSIIKATAWLLVLVLLFSFHTPQSLAQTSSSPGGYKISMARDYVSVGISGAWAQNLTQLPAFSFTLTDTNSSTLAGILSKAVQSKAPSARVTELFLSASSNGTLTMMNLQFKVLGVSVPDPWGNVRTNLAWRSFKVEDDVQVNGVAFNLVGKHYLSDELVSLARSALNPTQLIRITFEANGEEVFPEEIQELAPNLNLLDFSQLARPLGSSPTAFSLVQMTTTWTGEAGFDIAARTRIREATGEQIVISKIASYDLSVIVEAPGLAQLSGDTVIFGQSLLEPIMAAIVLLFPITYTGAYLAERRIRLRRGSRQRRR